MKIGISSWSYPWAIGVAGKMPPTPMGARALVEKAAELKADVVQFSDNLPLHALDRAQLASLNKDAQDAGILVEVGTRGVQPNNLHTYIGIAAELCSPILRTLLHDAGGAPRIPEARRRIEAVLPELEASRIVLAIENHDFYTTEELASLIADINSPYVKVCLDPVNNYGLGESLKEVLRALSEYTVNFHCKDYVISRKPSQLGFDVVGAPTGTGMLDMALCRKSLPDGLSYVVELWTPWQGEIEKTMAMEDDWAHRSMRFLHEFKEAQTNG